MATPARPLGPRRIDAGCIATERWLAARLNARHFRSLRLTSLQVLALASLPLWAQADGLRVWGWVAWLAFPLAGTSLALAMAYSALEHRWDRRAKLRKHPPRVVLQVAGTAWDEVRAGLWCALAAASVLPWASSGVHRPLPAWLLGALTLVAAALMSTLLVTEMIRAALRLEAGAFRRIIDIGADVEPQGRLGGQARQRLDDAS